jgi:CHRD domain
VKRWSIVALAVLAILGMQGVLGADDDDRNNRSLRARLTGFEEPPSISSTGRGTFRATISKDENSISYELRFSDLEGLVTQSHIHIAQRGVNGGISMWLCQTARNPGPTTTIPFCNANPDANEGVVTGTLTAADVIGPNAGTNPQGIAPGEFDEVLRAIRAGVAYANVHSTRNGPGEIRGQIQSDGRDDD